MNISVVIPTYNRIKSLKQVLSGLACQSMPLAKFEVVVVSDGSVDGTNEYLQTLETPYELKLVLQPNSGVAAARNAGIQAAVGDLVLFIDDDVVPTPHLLTEHANSHAERGDSVVVFGPMLTPPDFEMSPWVKWEQAMLEKHYEAMLNADWQPTARQFFTGNASLARRHLQVHGGFDTNFKRAEDMELGYRLADAGLEFVFNAEAIGYHYAERSFQSWLDISYSYGVNDAIFAEQKRQGWVLSVIWHEFDYRHTLIRALVNLCLDRSLLSKINCAILEKTALIGHSLRIPRLTNMAYSGIFNLRHYQGITDQLGGRAAFFAGLDRTRATDSLSQNHIVEAARSQTSMVDGGRV